VSAWISGDSASAVICTKNWSPPFSDEFEFYIRSSGGVGLTLDDSGGDTIGKGTVATATGAWQHVMATYDGSMSSGGINIYIDGVQQAATVLLDAGVYNGLSDTTTPVTIGVRDGGGNSYDVNGSIDEVRISSVERTACWIGASYNNQAWPDKAEPCSCNIAASDAVNTLVTDAT